MQIRIRAMHVKPAVLERKEWPEKSAAMSHGGDQES